VRSVFNKEAEYSHVTVVCHGVQSRARGTTIAGLRWAKAMFPRHRTATANILTEIISFIVGEGHRAEREVKVPDELLPFIQTCSSEMRTLPTHL